jgi:hypothetical protein
LVVLSEGIANTFSRAFYKELVRFRTRNELKKVQE